MSILSSFATGLAKDLGTTTSLEEFDVDINIGGEQDNLSPVDETGEPTVEASQVEVQEQEVVVEETNSVAEEAEADVETLESIHLALGKSLDRGGLDTVSYEMFNISLNTVFRKYGIRTEDVIPSMESFQEDRELQTRVSMEKTEGALSKAGKFAKDVLLRVWYEVKKLVFRIVQVFAPAQDKRARKLIEATKDLGDLKDKDAKIQLYSAKRLSNDGKIMSPAEVNKNLGNLKGLIDRVSDNGGKALDTVTDKLIAGDLNEKYSLLVVKDTFGDVKLSGREADAIDLFFEDAKLEISYKGTGKDMVKSVKVKKESQKTEGVSAEKFAVAPMTPSEIKDTAVAVLDLLKAIEGAKKVFNSKTEKQIERAVADAKAINGRDDAKAEKLEGEAKEAADKAGKTTKAEFSALLRSMITAVGAVNSHASSSAKAALDYAAQSVGAYEKAKK